MSEAPQQPKEAQLFPTQPERDFSGHTPYKGSEPSQAELEADLDRLDAQGQTSPAIDLARAGVAREASDGSLYETPPTDPPKPARIPPKSRPLNRREQANKDLHSPHAEAERARGRGEL